MHITWVTWITLHNTTYTIIYILYKSFKSHRSYFKPLLLHSDCVTSIRWQDLIEYTYKCVTSATFLSELPVFHFPHKNTPKTAATLAADTPTSNCTRLAIYQLQKLINYKTSWCISLSKNQALVCVITLYYKIPLVY